MLGVNYRTVVANLEAGRLSRRMRNALRPYQESDQPKEVASIKSFRSRDTMRDHPTTNRAIRGWTFGGS